MEIVEINGWDIGFNGVKLCKLLRTSGTYSLSEAKHIVDHIVHGKTLLVTVRDSKTFCEAAKTLGAKCIVNDSKQL